MFIGCCYGGGGEFVVLGGGYDFRLVGVVM